MVMAEKSLDFVDLQSFEKGQPCIGHLGLRFFLRPNGSVPDALCLEIVAAGLISATASTAFLAHSALGLSFVGQGCVDQCRVPHSRQIGASIGISLFSIFKPSPASVRARPWARSTTGWSALGAAS
jgi:hypothetical protein